MTSSEPISSAPETPDESTDSQLTRSQLTRIAQRAGIDRAVGFAILTKFWQLLTGPITQLLIVLKFSTSTQNYYYAFNSMLGMQVFVELGLHAVLINLASREWARLGRQDGQIVGDPESKARLASLGRMTLRFYQIIAVLFSAVACIGGSAWFLQVDADRVMASPAAEPISWLNPWICLVLLNGIQLAILPVTAILEGCHQLTIINRIRFWQGALGSIVVWITIECGYGLWALVASSSVRLFGELYLIYGRFPEFIRLFRNHPASKKFRWRDEVLPLQWRMALQGVAVWAASQMPILVLLKSFPDSPEAGRLGMTWTILTAFQSAGMAIVETRRPVFGSLIERGEINTLNRLFRSYSIRAVLAITILTSSLTLFVGFIGTRTEWLAVKFAERLLPVEPVILLSAAFIAYQFVMCIGIYIRAHRKDPLVLASVASCAVIAGLEFWLGRKMASSGVALGYCLGVVGILLPSYIWIWRKFRQDQSSKFRPSD